MNPLRALEGLDQSVWIDDIHRGWLDDGTMLRLVVDDGISGVTSNPAIFEKAIAGGDEYTKPVARLAGAGAAPAEIYEALVLSDLRAATDLLRPVWESSAGRDGYASLEVSPHLAGDTGATLREARRLWRALDRPNAMIKVPATAAGLPAISTLVAEGINVNVTLLFGLSRYREVVDSFLAGLARRVEAGGSAEGVASVASFFVSRIDTFVDARLDALGTAEAGARRGKAAIAAARLAYADYREWTQSGRWRRLAALGARPQRLLWASTSTKDPRYEDTRYVEALIGPQTVSTMPPATLEAYRDHGRPAVRLDDDLADARAVQRALSRLGIDPEAVSRELEREGVRKFVEPFDRLQALLARRVRESMP
jgi:transaldolase